MKTFNMLSTKELHQDRQSAAKWAYDLLQDKFTILDTETTGLGKDAEICELAVINEKGRPLLSTLIKPTKFIPSVVTEIHGIDNQAVTQAPSFADVHPLLAGWTVGKKLLIYNASYDTRILRYCCELAKRPFLHVIATECVMLQYSQWVGDWNDYRGSYRWQKLTGGDHSALGDCRATLDVIKRMAESYVFEPVLQQEIDF